MSKPRRNKPYRPKPVIAGIAGMPLGSIGNQAHDYLTRSIARHIAVDRLGTTEFGPGDMNELIFTLNTAHQLAVLYDDLQDCPGEEYCQLRDILQSLRNRRDRTGKYGLTGDELTAIKPLVTRIQDWLGTIPAARVAQAERQVMSWHRHNGPHVAAREQEEAA